jgi:hypothetical protein
MNKDALLIAVEAALASDWEKSHNIAQEYEAQDYSDATANWIHAVLHKMEGDQSNNGENAKNYADFTDAKAELKAIKKTLI